jgi:hypothetical protein
MKKYNYLLLNMKVLTLVGGFVKNFKFFVCTGSNHPRDASSEEQRLGHLGQGWINIVPFEIM